MESNRNVLLSVRDLDVVFRQNGRAFKAIDGVSFDVYEGETLALVGESGSGKTTIGRAIVRLNRCRAGSIWYRGEKISGKLPRKKEREVVRRIQMIFQDPASSLNERATIEYILSEGLYNFHLYRNEADRLGKIHRVIGEVGLLPEHLTRYPHEFSGGQRQRIGVARSIVMEPELIIADEPISALDVSIRAQVLNLLKKFQRERGLTYLFIAHDLSVVRYISDRIIVICGGRIMEIAETEELFRHPMHPYTRSLLSAVPIPDPLIERAKKTFIYDRSRIAGSGSGASLEDVGNGHMVYGTPEEIEAYRKRRAYRKEDEA